MKNQKKSWKRKARNWAVGGMLGLAALVSGCGSNEKLIDKDTITKPYVETSFVSDYVAKHGAMAEGQVRQDFVSTNVNDKLSAFMFQATPHDDTEFYERDFGVCYTQPVNEDFSIRGGYQYWDYPSGEFGSHDEVLKAGANYSGFVDVDYDLTQLLPQKNTESGSRHYWKVSKDFKLGEVFGADVYLTPSVSTALLDNYYGESGVSQVTPGVNLGFSKGNWNMNFFINSQDGKKSISDKNYSGVSVGYKF